MCDFISWIEKDGNIYYLTYRDIYHTKRGKELRDYCESKFDYIGHGAIRYFYDNFEGGKDLKCTDFSNPQNFPSEIVSAIKKGEFRGLGVARDLLNAEAQKAYDDAAWSEAQKAKAYYAAWSEAQKAYAAWSEAQKAYYAAGSEAQKAYAAGSEAQKAYAAWSEAQKAYYAGGSEFWDLFKIKKNRNLLWR